MDLARFRTESEGDRLQDQAVRVHAFCLPGREDELSNSAMMIPRVLDSFVDCYQTFRLGKSYELVFVDDMPFDTAHTMALTICSSRLLYPENVWEPLEHTTRTLVHAVASQWIGVDVIAQEARDHWIIAGASWFMTEFYLRDLFGRNDHRFQQKMNMEKLLRMDIRRPSLHELGRLIHLDPASQEFMDLKALAVLSVLHNRLVKTSGKNGVDRCLYRLLLNRAGGSLNNGAISTDAFLTLCEKVGHQKLDSFFNQWVYGSGYPIFECQPSFNKKRQTVNLTIRQTQSGPLEDGIHDLPLSSGDFMREAKERSRGFQPKLDMPAFVGPMTIRIHEADGTPYEHIIEINSHNVRAEIPYNTKYKRIKRNKLNKERQAQVHGVDVSGEQDEVTIYSLGDLFLNTEEAEEWKIQDWATAEEQSMENEAYEYIRIDADFEWLAKININDMRSYMFISQLQQDKDVVAQAESIQWLARKEGHGIISSFLVKTLMDERYFHGIRTMAADVLANQYVKDRTDPFIGLFHLTKAFKKLFYDANSNMTRPNDFSNRALYKIQCAIPTAISKVKGGDGRAPAEVTQFLLDIIRHNDNRGNDFSDDYYLSTILRALANCLADSAPDDSRAINSSSSAKQIAEKILQDKAIGEMERHKRLDEWIPSYNNIFTTTALDCDFRLMINRMKPLKISEFLFYSQTGNAENVRLKAWECLVRLGVFCKKDTITRYLLHELYADPSPYFKTQLLRIIGLAIGKIAVGDAVILDDLRKKESDDQLFEFGNEHVEAAARKDRQDRFTLEGALKALKNDLVKNETLKQAMEDALKANASSLQIVSELLDLCEMFVEQVNKLIVTFKYPRYWGVQRVLPRGQPGTLPLRFHLTKKIRTKKRPNYNPGPALVEVPIPLPAPLLAPIPTPVSAPIPTPIPAPPPAAAPVPVSVSAPTPQPKPKINIKLSTKKSTLGISTDSPSRPPVSNPGTPITTPSSHEAPRNPPIAITKSAPTSQPPSKTSTPVPSQAPSPAPQKETSTPMEGVESTSSAVEKPSALPPRPSAIPLPAAAAPTPTPPRTPTIMEPKAPKLKFRPNPAGPKQGKVKTSTSFGPLGSSLPRDKQRDPSSQSHSQPSSSSSHPAKPKDRDRDRDRDPHREKDRPSKPTPRRITTLRLPPSKLAALSKRKATSDINERPAKRVETGSTVERGGGGLVTWERRSGERARFVVRMRVGRRACAGLGGRKA